MNPAIQHVTAPHDDVRWADTSSLSNLVNEDCVHDDCNPRRIGSLKSVSSEFDRDFVADVQVIVAPA